MSPLLKDDRRELLRLARRTILESVSQCPQSDLTVFSESLARPSGAFVTLYRAGRLRGCIGRIEAVEALARTVVHCAVGAALHDPRFPPVGLEEIVQLTIEISVLSIPQPIPPGVLPSPGAIRKPSASRSLTRPSPKPISNSVAFRCEVSVLKQRTRA